MAFVDDYQTNVSSYREDGAVFPMTGCGKTSQQKSKVRQDMPLIDLPLACSSS
jgi:hypothetical protein